MHCTSCGHYLTEIRHGGCGGNGGLEGCSKCDAVFRLEGGGICSSAHPVLDRHRSFGAEFYQAAKEIQVKQCDWGDHKGQWMWYAVGYTEFHYSDTELEATNTLLAYIRKLHDELPWPKCDKCGVKPEHPHGAGAEYFVCRPCKRFWAKRENKWTSSDGE